MRFLIVLFSCALISAVYCGCADNPILIKIYEEPQFGLTLPIPDQTTTQKDGCPAYDGKATCCNGQVVTAQVQVIKEGNEQLGMLETELEGTDAQLIQSFFDEETDLPDSFFEKLERMVKKLVPPMMNCLYTLMGTFKGAMCYACEPNFADFIDKKTNALKVDQETCDSASKFCEPLMDALNVIKDEMLDLFSENVEHLQEGVSSEEAKSIRLELNQMKKINVCQLLSMYLEEGVASQSDCKAFICYYVVPTVLSYEENAFRRRHGVVRELGARLVRQARTVHKRLAALGIPMSKHAVRDATNAVGSIDYEQGGYPMMKNGCSFAVDGTKECPEKIVTAKMGSSNRGRAAAIVIGVLLVMAAVVGGVLLVIRRRNSRLMNSATYAPFDQSVVRMDPNQPVN